MSVHRRQLGALPLLGLWVAVLGAGCGQVQAPPLFDDEACATPRPPAGLWIAGSGANLTLARALTRRYGSKHPQTQIVLPESIGTAGAVAALTDGVIQLGLGSRPLTEEELQLGMREWPAALAPIGVATSAGVPASGLSHQQLEELFSARRTRWPDGSPVVPFLRESGDSAERIVSQVFPRVGRRLEESRTAGHWTVFNTEQQLRDALSLAPGSVGLLDAGVAREAGAALQLLALDGVAPTLENVRTGRYPLVRRLTFITRGTPSPDAEAFLAFVASAEGRQVTADAGYLPVEVAP